jgi:hypothetical protein
MNTNELKPCPFCGCAKVTDDGRVAICYQCGAAANSQVWNTRTIPSGVVLTKEEAESVIMICKWSLECIDAIAVAAHSKFVPLPDPDSGKQVIKKLIASIQSQLAGVEEKPCPSNCDNGFWLNQYGQIVAACAVCNPHGEKPYPVSELQQFSTNNIKNIEDFKGPCNRSGQVRLTKEEAVDVTNGLHFATKNCDIAECKNCRTWENIIKNIDLQLGEVKE